MSEQNDCEEQGFSRIEDGCFACAPTFVDGQPVRPRIEPRGAWLCCVKCGGSYGPAPELEENHG